MHAKTCDVSDPIALQEYIESAVTALDGLNILVNNPSGFGRTDDEQGWQVGLEEAASGAVEDAVATAEAMPAFTSDEIFDAMYETPTMTLLEQQRLARRDERR